MDNLTEEQLAEIKRIAASVNGKKGADVQWEKKYPKGSAERLQRIAYLKAAGDKGRQSRKQKNVDNS